MTHPFENPIVSVDETRIRLVENDLFLLEFFRGGRIVHEVVLTLEQMETVAQGMMDAAIEITLHQSGLAEPES